MVTSTSSPYKRYYSIFYKGLGLAHWVYDRENFAVSIGFNRGTLLYSRGRWTKVKPGGDPGLFFGREVPGGRELWSVDSGVVNVVPWDKLLGRKSRLARRSEQITDGASVADFCVIDDVALAVGDDGSVFRRTTPVTNAEGTWQVDTTLKTDQALVAIAGRSLDDIWVAGEDSVWHYDGAAWKRVRLRSVLRTSDIACGSKDVYVCGGETLLRIGSRGHVKRFDSEGCDFETAAFYKGALYLSVRDADEEQIGIWTLTRGGLKRVNTGFPPGWEHQPCGQLEVRAGLLWSFGNFGVYVFDGKRWQQLPNPKVPT
jgi:hypothetical protein